ncbi:MAG: hypothetical protein C4542_08480 [Dehalococcoidia bacterium]|nr:MAG: hypothetical protein C4542_08480 [Dehalococcoidia bacterium]
MSELIKAIVEKRFNEQVGRREKEFDNSYFSKRYRKASERYMRLEKKVAAILPKELFHQYDEINAELDAIEQEKMYIKGITDGFHLAFFLLPGINDNSDN